MTRAEMEKLSTAALSKLATDAAGHIIGERAAEVLLSREITGPRVPRDNEAARRGEPMTAANVRHILMEMERDVKSDAKRRRMAGEFAEYARNVSPEGVAIYRAYASGAKLN